MTSLNRDKPLDRVLLELARISQRATTDGTEAQHLKKAQLIVGGLQILEDKAKYGGPTAAYVVQQIKEFAAVPDVQDLWIDVLTSITLVGPELVPDLLQVFDDRPCGTTARALAWAQLTVTSIEAQRERRIAAPQQFPTLVGPGR